MPKIILPHNWTPRNYQLNVWRYFQGPEENKRGVCVWHRRAGKDLLAINLIATKVAERIGTYWHMLPTYKQGRNIVWNGFTRDGRKFLDHFPKEMVTNSNSTEMRLTFYNGSNYQVVGTDDINSLVGTNPVGVVFSEYSLHDPAAWDYIRPILAENGGWALFIYTARGKNHGYKLIEMAKKNPKWFSEILVAGDAGTKREDGKPVIPDSIIQEERDASMPEAMIQQEFYCSFEAPFVGAYYAEQMMQMVKSGRVSSDTEVIRVPHEPKLPVHTAWDIGVADSTAIWFYQQYGMEIRVIDFYENSGEGLPHYAKVLKGQGDDHAHRREYVYGMHSAPHDIEVREWSSGKSRKEIAKDLGIKFTPCKQHEVEDGIEVVRNTLPMCWIDSVRCARGLEALRQYRKEWDEKNKCFKNNPLHDWTSHAADGFRYLCMGMKMRPKNNQKPQRTARDDYDYLNDRKPEEVST